MAAKKGKAKVGGRGVEKKNSYRMLNGKEVRPVKYIGKNVGHGGTYMAGSVDGELVVDATGRPIPYKRIG